MPRTQVTNRFNVDNMSHSLHFDGSQRIALTTMGNLGSSLSGAFSFGCWLKTTSILTTAQNLFGCSNSSGGNYAFCRITRLSTRIGKVSLDLRDNSGRTLTVEALGESINTGEWVHLVVTKDATNTPGGIKIYLNGVSKTLTTVSNTGYADPINFNRTMAIGSSLGSGVVSGGWVGSISRPYFYLSELTPTQVSQWYLTRVAPANPFASYLNTEGANTTITDSQGANNGTLTADTMWSTNTPYKSRPQRQL